MFFCTPPAPYVHTCGIGTAVWYIYLFVLESSLRGACSSCVLAWDGGGGGAVWVWSGM